MRDELLMRYSRHIMLDDVGLEGQERLAAARALIVGVGGLGSPAAIYLASAGVGELIICDDDKVELSNLQRQILHSDESVGAMKVQSARARLRLVNPHCRVRAVHERAGEDNAADLIAAADVVIDGSDNYRTRHLINRACVAAKTPLIFGAAAGFDGQASVFDARDEKSPCYSCLYSERDEAADVRCALLGVLAPLTGIIGCIQAAQAIMRVAAPDARGLIGRLLLIDARAMRWREVSLPRDPACEVCGAR